LKCPLSYLDELTPYEIGLLIINYNEEKMNHYEMISTAFAFGYASAKKGKKIEMFKKQKAEMRKISEDKRDKDKEFLLSVFSKEGGTN
jgi:hypothetical protein